MTNCNIKNYKKGFMPYYEYLIMSTYKLKGIMPVLEFRRMSLHIFRLLGCHSMRVRKHLCQESHMPDNYEDKIATFMKCES